MRAREDGITPDSFCGEVDLLKVAGGFIETKQEEKIMHEIAKVKNVQDLLFVTLSLARIKDQDTVVQHRLKRAQRISQHCDRAVSYRNLTIDPSNRKPVREVRGRRLDWVIGEWSGKIDQLSVGIHAGVMGPDVTARR